MVGGAVNRIVRNDAFPFIFSHFIPQFPLLYFFSSIFLFSLLLPPLSLSIYLSDLSSIHWPRLPVQPHFIYYIPTLKRRLNKCLEISNCPTNGPVTQIAI